MQKLEGFLNYELFVREKKRLKLTPVGEAYADAIQEGLAKIANAIDTKREGDVVIRAQIEEVKTGHLKAAGQGLYLPVWGTGTASVILAPR